MRKLKNLMFLLLIIIFPMLISAEIQNASFSNNSSSTTPLTVSSLSISTQPVLNTMPSSYAWNELGPRPLVNPNQQSTSGSPLSGRITAIIVNQSSPDEMYVGSAQGGVWKTTNNGASWVPLIDNLPNLAVGSLTISPDNKTLYVGTGEPNRCGDCRAGIGIYKSADEGNTWTLLGRNVFENTSVSSISVNKTNSNWVLASSTRAVCCKLPQVYPNSFGYGIFLSRDAGQTWVPTDIDRNFSDIYGIAQIIADPSNNTILFASDFGGHVFESENSGINWTLIPSLGAGIQNPGRVAISISSSEPNILFASFADKTGNLVLTFTYNLTNGNTNTFLSEPFIYGLPSACNGQCNYDFFVAADPTNASIVYIGGVSLFRTLDQGINWEGVAGYGDTVVHPDFHAIDFVPGNPSKIIVGSDGGVYSSTNMGKTWTNLNTNLGLTQFYYISSSPTNDSVLIGGTQDNGCDQYTNSTTWNMIHEGDAGSSLYFNDSIMICNYPSKGIPGVAKSTDGGKTFVISTTGINKSDPSLMYPPMAQDPHNKSIIYYGTDYLYKSDNFGDLWNPLGTTPFLGVITTIGLNPSNQNILYVGTNESLVYETTNGGLTWNKILNATNFTFTNSSISGIAVDMKNPSKVYVSFVTENNPKLVMSNNSGSAWTTVSNLGEIPTNDAINVLKINPVTDTLFLGTNQGMYFYNGTDYNLLGSGLPNSSVYDFTFTHSNYLVAATHGRGVWLNYITPLIDIYGISNEYKISTANIQITDPNGVTQAFYNWDNGNNQTTTAGIVQTTVPTSLGQHTLKVFAQDPTGNWRVRTLEITIAKASSTSSQAPGFEIFSVLVLFICLGIVYKHKKSF